VSVNRLRSALVAGVSATMLFGAAAVASASPASAGSSATTCPSRSLCLYDGTNYTGELYTLTSFNRGGSCVSLVDYGWGDRVHSVRNTHNASAAMFMNDDCVGGPYQVSPNSGISNLGSFTPDSVWVPYWGS
jgi:hypothetical protein